MTSKPASRSVRATILAPRSWPSRPGFATRTLVATSRALASSRKRSSEDHRLLELAPDRFQRVHHLPHRAVVVRAVDEVMHQVVVTFRRSRQRGQAGGNRRGVTVGLHL